jgi:putative inorganic carbon (HCO3(-)) transporter
MNILNTELKYDNVKKLRPSFSERVRRVFVVKRLQSPIGILFLVAATIFISSIISHFGTLSAIMILIFLIGVPLVFAIIVYPYFGIIILLTSSYLIMWVDRMGIDFPMGTLMDALEALLIIGFVLKHKYDNHWNFLKNPISIMILVWIAYNILEVVNPAAESRLAWIYTVRTVAIVMLTYFIFMYHINSVSFIRLLLKIWIALSVFAALYTFKQEYFDFFPFEKRWLANDPGASALYFIAGRWRKFSIFSDPVSAAYNMVISSLLCITLMFGPIKIYKKIILGFLSIFFVMAMLYSGTRGAFVLIPAGIALLFILKLNIRIIFIAIFLGFTFIFLIKVPTSNGVLYRFQTAFRPSKDASFNVRKANQKRIQPYIQSHPMGGGLGSTGVWGHRFSPNSYLASFPPDSGYVRVAVEMGWLGLLLLCSLMFIIIKTGIKNYFQIKDPELKTYCLAMIVVVFALNIGNFPQEALVQYPINIYFYLAIALINITLTLDLNKRKSEKNLLIQTNTELT